MELPLFPLHVVLFPGRPLPLHIFEPRYRQMLSDCLEGDRCFGVVAIRSGQESAGAAEVFEVGTVARIESVNQAPDGKAELVTRGATRFRILELLDDDTEYLRARVELLDEATNGADASRAALLRDLLGPYLASLGAPDELVACLPRDPGALAYLAAAALHIEVPAQQHLLELDSCAARLDAALSLLRRETRLMRHLGTVGSLRPPGPGGCDLN